MRREIKWLPIVIFATSGLLLLPIFLFPSDWAGWLLVYFSFVLPLFFAPFRQDRKLLTILLIIVAAHNAVSIYNAYGSTVFGATLDAVKFQDLAKDFATDKHPLWFTEFDSLEIGTNAYTRFLASFYRVFGVSLLLGQTLSVIAYTLSCIILISLAKLFRFRFRQSLLVLYGLSAGSLIYCSIIMREAWQVLSFLLVIYLAVRLRISPSVSRAILMLVSGLVLSLLHNGLFLYSILLLGVSIYWGISGKWRKAGYKKILIRTAILGVAFVGVLVWLYFGGEIGGATKAIRTGDVVVYTETYREKGEQDAAANYQVQVDASSPLAFIASSSLVFIYYQFAPFPWQVTRPLDAYATIEGILRFVLIIYSLRLWWRARGERRQRYTYLIFCYFSLEFLWALGTGNWGTAVRHHIVAYAPLVLLGGPGLIYNIERLLRRLRFRRKAPPLRRIEIKGIKATS
ncbi:MAG: hypothetical protein JNM09_13380 [Blastocatellia bacterium]|nr:hypothetical protein [Blastocatellia bacterium]